MEISLKRCKVVPTNNKPKIKNIKMKKAFYLLMFLFIVSPIIMSPVWAADDKPVVLNIKTRIYHNLNCVWAKRCTKNCIKTTKQETQAEGARACKVCGG